MSADVLFRQYNATVHTAQVAVAEADNSCFELLPYLAQSAGTVEYTDCNTLPMSVLDMTLNDLMVWFQRCWSFEECGAPLHCNIS